MKKTVKVFLCLTLAVLLVFTGCTNKKNNSSSNHSSGAVSKVESNLESGASKIESGMESAGSDIKSGIESGASKVESGMESGASKIASGTAANGSANGLNTESIGLDQLDIAALDKLNNKKQGWGQGVQKNEKNQPLGSISAQEKYGKYNAYYIAPDSKKIYLTFDEGYENGYTEKILDALKEKEVSAVFFITYDYAKRNPELVQRMIDEGHIVGNHTYSHPSMPDVSTTKAAEEIIKLHEYVKENFNYTMFLFRNPMGEFSERTLQICKDLGYQSVFWSFAYADWDPNKQIGSDAAFQKVTQNVHDGAIYLLHAVSKDNAAILGHVIDDIHSKGFEIAKWDLYE